MSHDIVPFTLAIPQNQLDDLRSRLGLTRWPERETVDDWSQGAPLAAAIVCDAPIQRRAAAREPEIPEIG
jgi:Epoxide hydrolase N terminus